jgi:hypothetical protein
MPAPLLRPLQGVRFDAVYAWEAKPQPGGAFYAGMPAGLLARTHFYNFPVTSSGGANDSDSTPAMLAAPTSPLAVLAAVAAPGDFVVLKLDIDVPSLELPLLRALAEHPALAARVDELFWEAHVRMLPEMGRFGPDWPHYQLPLAEGRRLLARLRRAGIRAHPWP